MAAKTNALRLHSTTWMNVTNKNMQQAHTHCRKMQSDAISQRHAKLDNVLFKTAPNCEKTVKKSLKERKKSRVIIASRWEGEGELRRHIGKPQDL